MHKEAQHKEEVASKEAKEHADMLREEHGEDKIIDLREAPNGKDIIKIGDEIAKMKKGGVPKDRIHKEMNQEALKYQKVK